MVAPPPMVAAPPIVSAQQIAAPATVAASAPVGISPSPVFPGLGQPGAPVAPPPLLSPGALSGVSGAPAPIQRVLVGFLVTFQNEPAGSFWPIYSGRMQLGRTGSEGVVDVGLADASASSRHASIHSDPTTGYAFAEDDGSRNGTFLNEQKLAPGERRQMRDNDRLRLGSTTFVVKLLVS